MYGILAESLGDPLPKCAKTKLTSTAPNPQYEEQYKNVPNQNENITVAQGSNSTNTNQLPTFDLSNMDLLEFDD